MNNIIPLCFIALVAIIQTVSTIDKNDNSNAYDDDNDNDDDDDANDYEVRNIALLITNNLENNQYSQERFERDVHHIIDGQSHRVKNDIVYHQRLRDDQCVVEYNGQFLTENSVIQIRKKLYRVEGCLLERVFHACGPNLLLMLNVVCRVVEKHQTTTTTTTTTTTITTATIPMVPATPVANIQKKKLPSSTLFFHRKYSQLFRQPRDRKIPRVITESCCENLCSITELTRYCRR